jgi:predicted TIM-barrel fold metal-dependent hydrolase
MRIDAHNHPNWYGYSFDRFIRNMDENGIDKTCIISWETPMSEHIIGQTWIVSDYLTPGASPVPAPFSQCIDFKMRAPERFILGYGPDPRDPRAIDQLHSAILNFDTKICGEIKYRMMYDNPDAIDLFRYAGEQGLPVILHFDYPEATRQKYIYPRRNWWYGGDIDTLERVLKLCPDTNFLGHAPGFWCHISNGDEGRTVSKPKGPVIRGGKIEQFLDKYPNLYCDCSAKSAVNALSRDTEYSKELMLAHPDRFVFARDNFESELITLVDGFGLPEDVREMFYSKNLLRLIHEEEG